MIGILRVIGIQRVVGFRLGLTGRYGELGAGRIWLYDPWRVHGSAGYRAARPVGRARRDLPAEGTGPHHPDRYRQHDTIRVAYPDLDRIRHHDLGPGQQIGCPDGGAHTAAVQHDDVLDAPHQYAGPGLLGDGDRERTRS